MLNFIKNQINYFNFSIIFITTTLLVGCSTHQRVQIEKTINDNKTFRLSRPLSWKHTHPMLINKKENVNKSLSLLLSVGDKLNIHIPDSEEFNGIHTIDVDGFIKLPYLKPIYANGVSIVELQTLITKSLIFEHIFQADFLTISLRPVQWSAAFINVKGAVYKPGNLIINERDFKTESMHAVSKSGDFADKRLLSSALKAAGGLRPDADLSNIQLIRQQQHYHYDYRGIFSGDGILYDPFLRSGDTIIVPSVGYLQKELLQVSRITPPGFRIFLSNLTVPSRSNSNSAIGKYSSNLPIGSRLLTAAMSANCVGGTQRTNANKQVVLAGIDIKTNRINVTQKSIGELLANPNSDFVNPYLMPNDQVACFDSSITNWRDIGRTLTDILSPLKLMGGGL